MKRLITILNCLLFLCYFTLQAQPYANEWIDFDKTYYKIKTDEQALYRVPFSVLSELNLPNIGNGYQLFHEGQQVPIYVTTSGEMGNTDYLEFYGKRNDGHFDTQLFAQTDWQTTTRESLFSDEAAFFLTWDNANPAGNLRFIDWDNDLTNAPERTTYCTHTIYQRTNNAHSSGKPHRGNSFVVSYADFGENEGFASVAFSNGEIKSYSLTANMLRDSNLEAYVEAKVVGRSSNLLDLLNHRVRLHINGTIYADATHMNYEESILSATVPVDFLPNTPIIDIDIEVVDDPEIFSANSVAYLLFTYPNSFDFGSRRTFEFSLPNDGAHYFEVRKFNGGDKPVLYDLTNHMRLEGIEENDIFKFHLPVGNGNEVDRNLFLSNTTSFLSLNTLDQEQVEAITFTDFSQNNKQGDYIILTHSSLTNPAAAYENYRRSEQGGSHKVVNIDIEQLYNQFAYGVDQHPLSIRHFVNFALDNWVTTPQFLLILGKGIGYNRFRTNPLARAECLVPTYGDSYSDHLLTARDAINYSPQLAVGRIPALTGTDIYNYLNKVMAQEAQSCEIEEKRWHKNILSLLMVQDTTEIPIFQEAQVNYHNFLQDGVLGSRVNQEYIGYYDHNFNFPHPEELIQTINDGVGIILQYGRTGTSSSNWAFPFPELNDIATQKRYPFVISNSNFGGNIFSYNNTSPQTRAVLAADKGFLGYADNLSFRGGNTVPYIDIVYEFTSELGKPENKHVGVALQKAVANRYIPNASTYAEVSAKYRAQLYNLVADPALQIIPQAEADYVIDQENISLHHPETGEQITTTPLIVNNNLTEVELRAIIANTGRATSGEIEVSVTRVKPDILGEEVIATKTIPAPRNQDTISFLLPNNDMAANGFNSFIVFADSQEAADESCEDDNAWGLLAFVEAFCEGPNTELLPDTVHLTQGETVTLEAGTDPNYTYEWSTGQTTASITVGAESLYTVTITDEMGCSSVARIIVLVTTSIEEQILRAQLTVYPNPAKDVVHIQLDNSLLATTENEKAMWQLFHLNGQLVAQDRLEQNRTSINIGNLSGGLYLLQLTFEEGIVREKIVIND